MSKPISKEEAREKFIKQARSIAKYWANESRAEIELDRCMGVVHSMLCMIDGVGMVMPAMDLVVRPHEDDKAFHIENNEDWFEDGTVINDDVLLHEIMYSTEE